MAKALVLILSSLPLAGASLYTVQSLGSVGVTYTGAIAISDTEIVAGTAFGLRGDWNALRFSGGRTDVLGDASMAAGVNNSGAVVGTSWSSGGPRATIWQNGGAAGLGLENSYGMGINDAGTVVGGAQNGNRASAYVYSGGETTWIDIGISSSAYDINAQGQVAGTAEMGAGRFRAFIWSAGTGVQVLGTLGGRISYANALSDSGVVVGSSTTRSGYLHAYTADAFGMHDLGTLGGNLSAAYAVNSAGTVVGYSSTVDGAMHAFVWTDGMLFDLNTLVDPASGWTLESAFGINELGQIVGSGRLNGVSSAYLLSPAGPVVLTGRSEALAVASVPEPSTWILAGCGTAFVAAAAARRRRLLAPHRDLVEKAVLPAVPEIDRQSEEQPHKQA
jgi:probable HAF family extracellular repeat protein